MAKNIKFNLIIDEEAVRSIEDLQNNFNLQDLLEVYKKGLLERWLKVREYDKYLDEVKEIVFEKDIEIAKKLVEIFELEVKEKEIKGSIYALKFHEEKEKDFKLLKKKEEEWQSIIDRYHQNYEELKNNLFEKKSDMAYIKEAVQELHNRYLGLFKLNYSEFYFEFMRAKSIFSILAVLMNKNLRNIFLEDEEISSTLFDDIIEKIKDSNSKYYSAKTKKEKGTNDNKEVTDKKVCIVDFNISSGDLKVSSKDEKSYDGEEIANIIKDKILDGLIFSSSNSSNYVKYVEVEDMIAEPWAIQKNIKIFSGETDGYWKDIEPKGKDYLIISMESGNYLRNAEEHGEELDVEDINGEFLILDGIDYKSDSQDDKLIYMEV